MTRRDIDRYPNAVAYTEKLIKELCPVATIVSFFDGGAFRFKVSPEQDKDKEAVISFSEERLEDFEEVIKAQDRSSYGMRFRYFVDFSIYLSLGRAGFIPHFKISEVFLKEERESWWKDTYIRISFDEEMTKWLHGGLKRLEAYLANNLKRVRRETAEVTQVKEDLERIRGILDYYERHEKSLNESAASVKSLSLLKAAAISEIIRLEKEKGTEKKPGFAMRAIDEEIYAIAERLRGESFLEVRPPRWLEDYAQAA